MRILITGCAGYIGSVLCPVLLKLGHDVTGVDNLMYGQPGPLHLAAHPQFEFLRLDVTDHEAVARLIPKFDIIVPLAAIVGAPACERQPALSRAVNCTHIANICSYVNPQRQRVVYPTTVSGYGAQQAGQICTEDTPLQPFSLYAMQKVEAEQQIAELENSVIVRLSTVFGASPRMRVDLLINELVWQAMNGYVAIYASNLTRSFVHVRDAAACFAFAIEHPGMRGTYNLSNERLNLSKLEVATKISELTGAKLIVDEERAELDPRNYLVASHRLRKLGFEASVDLDTGVKELIRAYAMLPSVFWRNGM